MRALRLLDRRLELRHQSPSGWHCLLGILQRLRLLYLERLPGGLPRRVWELRGKQRLVRLD